MKAYPLENKERKHLKNKHPFLNSKIEVKTIYFKNPLLDIREKTGLPIRRFSQLLGTSNTVILELENGYRKDIPEIVLDSLKDIDFIESKEELRQAYKEWFNNNLDDLRTKIKGGSQ